MGIDLTKFKVIYDGKVLNAVSLGTCQFEENQDMAESYKKPKWIEIIAIDTDGTIVFIRDETRKFQFVPRLT